MTDSALKHMYNRASVSALSDAIIQHEPGFESAAFVAGVFDEGWEDRELKARMRHITITLHDHLPLDYHASLDVLGRTLPDLAEQGFAKMVFPDFVEVYGLDDWPASMAALEAFTQHISAEFAVRPFIVRYPERTMARMFDWAQHAHEGVRRLATEGCRPRLPWGIALPNLRADPSPILPILETLRDDPSESVRRSVANNLNDISKDNPGVVIEVLGRWAAEDAPHAGWMTRHALRTLIKGGDPEALELLGYPRAPAITVRAVTVDPVTVPMGGSTTLSFEIVSESDAPQRLMIDYRLHLMRASGKLTPKVFKLTKRELGPRETLTIQKTVSFKPVTTRKYYPGEHAIEPQINGQRFERVRFEVR